MVTVGEALFAVVKEAASREGKPTKTWCELHGVPYNTVAKSPANPHVSTVFIVCRALRIRPSQFFKAIGR